MWRGDRVLMTETPKPRRPLAARIAVCPKLSVTSRGTGKRSLRCLARKRNPPKSGRVTVRCGLMARGILAPQANRGELVPESYGLTASQQVLSMHTDQFADRSQARVLHSGFPKRCEVLADL